jgi:hypothetical protein
VGFRVGGSASALTLALRLGGVHGWGHGTFHLRCALLERHQAGRLWWLLGRL